MAGGGSIPFEALRYGFRTFANELNPVASVILKATLDYPSRFGLSLGADIKKWGLILYNRVKSRLQPFFSTLPDGAEGAAYLWARTVACPTTGKPVPLSPNWWLQKGSKPIAVRLSAKPEHDLCQFEIVTGKDVVQTKPDEGTVSKGVGRSPWTGDPIDGDYIKAEAQGGRMGQQLFAVATKMNKGFVFRSPREEDLTAALAAERELARRLPQWEAQGLLPSEPRTAGRADWSAEIYGMASWRETFSPRQLLSLVTFVEELRELRDEIKIDLGPNKAAAIQLYLALAADKSVDYNSRLCKWDSTRNKISNTFDRHDFSFKWSHGEFDAAANLFSWTISQVVAAYEGIARLSTVQSDQLSTRKHHWSLNLSKGNAATLSDIQDDSIHSICVDPPYYDNVMYAECSDFFYVWMKRNVGDLFSGWFDEELTNKDDEVVANAARFKDQKKRKELATADYERKMAACFREMRRVLHPDGVLTVMFTHKRVEAWNTLATSLIGAGFSIQTSWPVHTESDNSLHQAKKNAAQSTILLICRKREKDKEPVWWDDIKAAVRREAREKARMFHAQGISGVDLYISTFGPVLSILSHNWPVLSAETDKDGRPLPLQPEVALDLAREEVISLRKEELLHGRKVQFDPVTDWYLMAWDAFRAEQFRADEARKLAIVLGLELDSDLIKAKKVVSKKSADVILQQPKARRKKGMVDPDEIVFESWLDAAHSALLIYEEDGSRACEAFLKRSGLIGDSTFKLVIQAMINAIPRTRGKGGDFLRPEAKLLDDLRLNFFEELTVPQEEEAPSVPVQVGLFKGSVEEIHELDLEEDGEDEEE
jgi:adenine-specific DNA methylase